MSVGQLTARAILSIADAAGIGVAASTAASQPKIFSQGPLVFPDAAQHHTGGCCMPGLECQPLDHIRE